MTTLREAAQMALDALEQITGKAEAMSYYCSFAVEIESLRAALAQPEQEPVGNTITFMTRAIFNIVADHQEINGGYFIADGDVAAFVDRLAKVINSTFEPLKHKNPAPPQQPKQEPVAYLCENAVGHKYFRRKKPPSEYKPTALYTTPPQHEWQGLTDEELLDIADMAYANDLELLQTLQAKLKEKNT